MTSTFDCCSPLAGKLHSGPSFLLINPFHVREFRVFRRRRLKHYRHAHRRTAFTVRSQSNPFESLFHNLVSQVTTVNSLELIAPALGFSSGVALYLSNVVSAKNSAVSDIGEWILLSSPTPFNRFVFLRCPSIAFPRSDTNLVEDVSEKLVKEDRHFVRLNSGRMKATTGDDDKEDKLTYQRLCISTEDGGVISLDWPSNLNLREEHGLDTTLLLVPGTPEGSMDKNVRLSVIEALGRGLFPIVMNPRGCAGSPLTTARLFSAADSDDIYAAVQFISKARPWTALMATGWGYGANMLTKYLAEVGERTPLTAATCIDNPFDLEEATQTPPYHMTIDHDLTGGLINILRSNKELFQGKAKGFDVEKALEAKSVRDFEKLISSVSHGFNSVEDFYSKSSTRSVVGNVKIPVLYIQNDNGSAPVFSIPRGLIVENPFTSLLMCSYSPSSIISSMKPVLSWCQQLSIEWLTAVELGLLKGRHPLLKDVDITINSSRGLALVEGKTVEERGKTIRQLGYNWSDASSGYQSTRFIKKKLEESHSSIHTDLRSQNNSQSKSQLEDKGSLEIEVGVLNQTSSISEDMGKKDEVGSEDTEKGQVLRTAEVVMNILDMTNPGTLTDEEKKKVLNAVGKGETLMKALQDAVPEEVRGKLTTALSGILHAQGSNLKVNDLIGSSQKSNATLELKGKTEEKVRHVAEAEGSSQISSPSHEMGAGNDVSDGSDSYQPTKDKFIGELESESPSSDKLQKSIDQNGSQALAIHGDDTISSTRKETSGFGKTESDDEFSCWTTFIDDTPQLFDLVGSQNRAQKLLSYLGDVAVNGSSIKGQIGEPKFKGDIIHPSLFNADGSKLDVSQPCQKGWRQILLEQGPKAFAKAVRNYKGCLLMDTTWRDAHQSLLATRVRTVDLLNIAPETSHALNNLFSLECWGGATFDVAFRFLYEDPWDRLRRMRKLVPNIPFQMLLRGANGVAYSSLPDNAIEQFVEQAKKNGVDIFRVFDALNDVDQLEVGIKAVHKAGGVVEAVACYSGDMLNPSKKYNLQYYLDLVDKLVALDIHVLGIKDMAGVLKPHAATLLIGAIREKYPDLPIHVHTHDSAGTGVASMVACAKAGADVVDAATDSLSGMTSQPSINAILASLEGSDLDPGLNPAHVRALDTYWSQLRLLYSPFEAHLTGPDPEVYEHEIPGGQLTNMMFQAAQLGLGTQWAETKKAYEHANDLLGDIVKVTPTSKVVGDLAQFMVSNKLSPEDVKARAGELDFPGSVLEFLEGMMGQPFGGFPEPLRSDALRGRRKLDARPGLFLEPIDFAKVKRELTKKFGGPVTDTDIASHIMYPKVFEDYKKFVQKYGDLSVLPTKYFLSKPEIGEEFHVELEKGKVLILKLLAVGPLSENTGQREVFYEMNGEVRQVTVDDKKASVENVTRPKADATDSSQIGAPMAGVLVELRVKEGSDVKKGDPIAVLSAMKMEMVISAPHSGKVSGLQVKEGDSVDGSDLVCRVTKA